MEQISTEQTSVTTLLEKIIVLKARLVTSEARLVTCEVRRATEISLLNEEITNLHAMAEDYKREIRDNNDLRAKLDRLTRPTIR